MELISKDRFLTVGKMDEISDTFATLDMMLINTLGLPSGLPEGMTDDSPYNNRVNYNTSPVDIIEKMNAVEKNIQAFHHATFGKIENWSDPYYKMFEWSDKSANIQSEVYRWYDWINSFYTMLLNSTVKELPIYTVNDEPLYTADGKQLYCKKIIYEER